ncbi:MAG: hypothetical protein Q8L24_01385 [bacterium]|nr:hypothetical protein [bacterium]
MPSEKKPKVARFSGIKNFTKMLIWPILLWLVAVAIILFLLSRLLTW